MTTIAARATFPREPGLDHSMALLKEGYRFIGNRCQRYDSDVFETRLVMSRVLCVTGEDAARMFYVPDRFTRRGALPPTALTLLQDIGSAATLDGTAHRHRHRKRMFMSLMTRPALERMDRIAAELWRSRSEAWQRKAQVVLHDEMEDLLCRAVCAWSGIELSEQDAQARTTEFSAMIDGAGSVGLRNARGQMLRSHTERWARGLIEAMRAGTMQAPDDSALAVIASHCDEHGELLPVNVAAVELINILRPTVAVARYVTFAALALHQHPQYREQLSAGSDAALQSFTQEVRRFYPFFPMVGGRALQPFEWRGHLFLPSDWVLLDLYGTNHDPALWEQPNVFRPERFDNWSGNAYTLIPQGGGEHDTSHRCAGEWLTIALLKTLVRELAAMRYDVPRQNMWIDLSRMPAIPASRFIMTSVRTAQ
jgi:fatty-acid peroxygenase